MTPDTEQSPVGPPVARRHALILVALVLATHYALAISGAWSKSPVVDEPHHLAAGYAYWRFNDYRLQPENGNLPQRWAGLSLCGAGVQFDRSPQPGYWETSR